MRKPRIIIYDDEVIITRLLEEYLDDIGYEVFAYNRPVICPIYGENAATCHNAYPCGDIVITDYTMPRMNGIELLRAQAERGCRVTTKNKAVISGYVNDRQRHEIKEGGYTFFQKPVLLSELSAWLKECVKRVDLSKPLGIRRKEMRDQLSQTVTCHIKYTDQLLNGIAVNISDSGLCLTLGECLSANQTVLIDTRLPNACLEATVQWIRKTEDGAYATGLSKCTKD
jgi:DNA-binding NtrC family response regulator